MKKHETSEFIQMAQNDYNWLEVFAFAGQPGRWNLPHVIDQMTGDPSAPFTLSDVTHVEMAVAGQREGDPWVCVGRLQDGRWFYLAAGCDYTGWDCQARGCARTALDADAIMAAITEVDLDRYRYG